MLLYLRTNSLPVAEALKLLALFTRVRGRGILRTSPVKSSRTFGLPYAGHGVRVHVLSVAECVAQMGALDLKAERLV
jgi:hypothetical protein